MIELLHLSCLEAPLVLDVYCSTTGSRCKAYYTSSLDCCQSKYGIKLIQLKH